ncbi:hypothetical protein ACIGN6_37235 [Streptomyces sp. NPDC053792]|uniref:hypothetical protein n=1 Tax=unclassified Streptomyces TaxID=2593676 RepID=UPI00343032D7
MSRIRTISPKQPLAAAGAAVIIVIVVTAAALTALTGEASPTRPLNVLGLLVASAAIGVLTIRLAATGIADRLRTSAMRILTPTPPHPRRAE